MKRLLKHFIINTVSLYLVSQVARGMVFENGLATLVIAGAALTLTTFIIKPIINLLLLPLNLITFGFFRWIASAVTLYLVTLIVQSFKISGFSFNGFSTIGITIPQVTLTGILAIIVFSFLISLTSSFFSWLMR